MAEWADVVTRPDGKASIDEAPSKDHVHSIEIWCDAGAVSFWERDCGGTTKACLTQPGAKNANTMRDRQGRIAQAQKTVAQDKLALIEQAYRLGCLADEHHDLTMAELMFTTAQANLSRSERELAHLEKLELR
jgi:hypothetical protein